MTTERARITTVKFAADLELECLMLPDGSFGIGVSQIASVFSIAKDHATRDVKALLGKGSSLAKTTSELHSRPVNFITLKQFTSVCLELTAKGNEIARRFMAIHVEASLISIVSYAFGVKFEQEQMVEYVESRETHRKLFHEIFTSWLKSDGCSSGLDYMKRLSSFKKACGFPGNLSVNDMTEEQLEKLNLKEQFYNMLRAKGMGHDDVLNLIR